MIMTSEMKLVLDRLDTIKVELDFIKKHMVDADTVMTFEESKRLDESLKEFKEGKTTPLADFEKEIRKHV